MRFNFAKLLAVLAVLAAGAGAWAWYGTRDSGGDVKYRLGRVERGALQAVVAASGTLNAVSTVQVGPQTSGQVMEILADFNTQVKKGQVLARIDPATFELRVNQARADLDAAKSAMAVALSTLAAQQAELERAKANLADAERDLGRKKILAGKNFISPAELGKAHARHEATREQLASVEARIQVDASQIESVRAAVKQRDALLKQAQMELERTLIRAPADGTVILRNVDAGQTIAAGPQAPVLFAIAENLREMQVEAAVDEVDAGRLRVGETAGFTVDALPRRSFSGEIKQIRRSPASAQSTAGYIVVISAANSDQALLPGMTANVRVVVDSRTDALKVPNAALRFHPPGGPAAAGRVWILGDDGRPSAVEVHAGLSDGTSTEILGGPLKQGAEVILGTGGPAGAKVTAQRSPAEARKLE